ncbi:MAG: MauE/DoxX family redox-associated membrane protein, partial [Chitinophagaceae bacterium]
MKRKVDLTTNSLPVTLARIIVGLLFIVSGFIKANDPLGLSYKMQEFFEVWNTDLARSSFFLKTVFIHLFEWLHNYSLPLSIAMIFLEIVAGIALLIGWQIKWVLRGLLVLILFFTFLTGYAFLSGKFKNCGCFGDCLPISPLTSFLKDVILFFLIVFLVLQQRKIVPYVSTKGRVVIMAFFLFIALAFQWYTLTYLPV